MCGAKTYPLMRSLVAPEEQCKTTYKDLCKTLQTNFCPKPSKLFQLYKLNTCDKKSGDYVSMYIAELRRLSEYCEFGSMLDEIICDRTVCDIADDRIHRRKICMKPKKQLDL